MNDVNYYEEWLGPISQQEEEQRNAESDNSDHEHGYNGPPNAATNGPLQMPGGLGDSTDFSDN